MTSITLHANAKINLALDIIGKREDGYHLMKMVMQKVSLCDIITMTRCPGPGSLECDCPSLPRDESNMAWRAFALMREKYDLAGSVHINIEKNIPVAAGLAGGSADAAAVLRGIDHLWQLDLPEAFLIEDALSLGADVPYCLQERTALAEGIGEKLTVLPQLPGLWVVLANPGFPVITGEIFRQYSFAAEKQTPAIDAMLGALEQQNTEIILASMGNVLESVTLKKYPIVARLKQEMQDLGLHAMMSGSGPTVMGLTSDAALAKTAVMFLKEKWPWVFLARTIE